MALDDNIPRVESQLFDSRVDVRTEYDMYSFAALGYTKIKLDVDTNRINSDVDGLIEAESTKQDAMYHYSDSPRIFEGWKQSDAIRDLALNGKVLDFLKRAYQRTAFPFQTINFVKGSNQPLHSDAIHFHTQPQRWVAAVWVALEDIELKSGPLVYVPNSHRLPVIDFYNLGIKIPEYGEQAEAYEKYEKYIEAVSTTESFCEHPFCAKKGEALVWTSNLIHGGDKIRDPKLTRKSQATHYYFEGCDIYYSPMFSNPALGNIAHKDLWAKDFYVERKD